jgi:hypothetical protein
MRSGRAQTKSMSSPAFFDVSPPDGSGKRTMVAHTSRRIPSLGVFTKQLGPNRLPLVFDKHGRMFEVARSAAPSPRVKISAGRLVELGNVRLDKRQLIFLDKAGARIEPQVLAPPKAAVRGANAPVARIERFVVNNVPIFLDRGGNLIEVEQNEADGNVLIAQNGSPIYYGIAVNEVMAYFRTMLGVAVPAGKMFPTTQGELDGITNFASTHGRTFIDPEALAFEIKTAWIETTGLADPGDYITMSADIPTYDKSNPEHWVNNGHKTATVALVGMHVVGSTAGHPEMIWATFEHLGNAPDDAYSYRNSIGGTTNIARSTAGSWLFTAAGSSGPFNDPHQSASGADIVAASPGTPIGPDNILRYKAWGAASDVSPNPLRNPAASNSEIISVNNSVRGMLASGDVRKNYIMTGSTWLIAGSFPFASFNTVEVGTSKMNNTSMETFTQGSNTPPGSTTLASGAFNCFSCHPAGKTTDVSHVFSDLKPLF